jgi:transposase
MAVRSPATPHEDGQLGGCVVIRTGELLMILELHRQGLSMGAIARRVGMDRKTVRKYIARGLEPPCYGPRAPRPCKVDPFREFLRERLTAFPELTAVRLLREVRELGYSGGLTALKDYVRTVRPCAPAAFEHRFETAPGQQAQVDFAEFRVEFTEDPGWVRKVWLFSLVLGFSRWLWGRFVLHQDLVTVLRAHVGAFEALGGVPRELLYDQMRTAVLDDVHDEAGTRHIIYNPSLLALAQHYSFTPRACAAYRAKTKGKIERPFRYVRQDFFLGRTFRNLQDLNAQYAEWRAGVANRRRHGTTQRLVDQLFAAEREQLLPLPAGVYRAAVQLERRITRDGVVSVGGNFYSVPDGTRNRAVEVHALIDEVQIFEDGRLIAAHPWLEGYRERRVAPGHRRFPPPGARPVRRGDARTAMILQPAGHAVAVRPLEIYQHIGVALARRGASP